MISKKKILVAPLNWGIGHATRCVPIIYKLIELGFYPIIASDGDALKLLQKEFPKLEFIELPSYKIQYPKNGFFFKWKMISQLPYILKIVKKENIQVQNIVEEQKLIGIISDNRFGIRSSKIPSVVISHQLNVLSGNTTFFSSLLHQYYIKKFDECWIPDCERENSLALKLSHSNKVLHKRFIGFLSRMKKENLPLKYNILVLLSGVEPLRSKLEKKLKNELKKYSGNVVFVRGLIQKTKTKIVENNITYYNYLLSDELEKLMNESEIVIARSGYSTIMDLAVLQKKAFFIPTNGQYEQEYLAKYLESLKIAAYSSADKFKIEMLREVENYSGFSSNYESEIKPELFHLFHGK